MSDNFPILDADNAERALNTLENGGIHTPRQVPCYTKSGAPVQVSESTPLPVALPAYAHSAFGDIITAELVPFVQATAVYNRLPANMRTYSANGGTASLAGGEFVCSTGTSVGGYGVVRSVRSVNYKGGMSARFRGTGRFTAGVPNSLQGVGFFNVGDALLFGYLGEDFGIIHEHGGLQEIREIEITAPSSGSTDLTLTLNGTAYTIPLTSGTAAHNAFEIEQWIKGDTAASAAWNAHQNGSKVVVSATSDGAKSGTYSFSHATATGTINTVTTGVTKTRDFYAQADWNVNPAPWLANPENGNVFQIDMPYLGYGNHLFYAENPNTGVFELVHQILWAGNNNTPSVGNPSMHIGVFAASLGSTTNLTAASACVAAFIAGTAGRTRNPRAFSGNKSVGTTLTSLFTIRNRNEFGGKANQIEIEPLLLTAFTESTKGAKIAVFTNATLGGETNFSYLNESNLVTETSTSETTVTGVPLVEFQIAGNSSLPIDLTPLRIRVPPGITLTVAAAVNSGAASNVGVGLSWYEDM